MGLTVRQRTHWSPERAARRGVRLNLVPEAVSSDRVTRAAPSGSRQTPRPGSVAMKSREFGYRLACRERLPPGRAAVPPCPAARGSMAGTASRSRRRNSQRSRRPPPPGSDRRRSPAPTSCRGPLRPQRARAGARGTRARPGAAGRPRSRRQGPRGRHPAGRPRRAGRAAGSRRAAPRARHGPPNGPTENSPVPGASGTPAARNSSAPRAAASATCASVSTFCTSVGLPDTPASLGVRRPEPGECRAPVKEG